MNRRYIIIITVSVLVVLTIFGYRVFGKELNKKNEDVNYIFSSFTDNTNYSKATQVRSFRFPDDFGSHDSYETEWWYYTGNLIDDNGHQFGYQLTFFRRALPNSDNSENRNSLWASDQIYMAHFTLTDKENSQHYQFESLSRGGEIELAGTKTTPFFEVWLYDWYVIQTGQDHFKLHASKDNISIDLDLLDMKGVVFHGNEGLSQKGPEIGNASYYFSQTRLKTRGSISINSEVVQVNGFSWMDHEFGTSALGSGQVGWDWFSIQLDSNEEFMFFQIRDGEGNISPYSSGSYISPDGKLTNIVYGDFQVEVLDAWKTDDGFEYPISWLLTSDKLKLALNINPSIKDQENKLFFRYWEGAVNINGFVGDEQVNGFGYVELTGYAQSMEGVF